MFKVPNHHGLADVLLGKLTVDEVILKGTIPNIDFMPSGKLPSVSHGALNAQHLRDIIGHVRNRYDYVFFDSPPIMGVSDASILSSEVDGVLLVIQHRSYPRAVSGRAKAMIENVGGNLVGVVLNNLNVARDYYYYYSSYYSNYSYGKPKDRREERAGKAMAEAQTAAKADPGGRVTGG
jgi:capsular exopolysaccharide synthesis family protein